MKLDNSSGPTKKLYDQLPTPEMGSCRAGQCLEITFKLKSACLRSLSPAAFRICQFIPFARKHSESGIAR